MIPPSKLEVKDSPISGRGVFATEDIIEGEVVEECHFLPITLADYKALENLQSIVHNFPTNKKNCVVVLGYGSIYNHSSGSPNAYWETDEENNLFRFIALTDISAGQEALVDYKKPDAP